MIRFLDILDFPGYRVGEDGSVWSNRVFAKRQPPEGSWHQLKPVLRRGYARVSLRRDGKHHWRSVHSIVLESFIGPCPNGYECCHGPGGRLDNHLANLRWDSRLENGRDQLRHGTAAIGEKKHDAKLSARDIPVIREMLKSGHSRRNIAQVFSVSHAVINGIAWGKLWSHVA